jgi:putative SOS response-associated peptidase YedK
VRVPALGYYEWNTLDEGQDRPRKQAYYLHPISDTALSFAGLYEWWRRPDATDNDPDRWLLSATILTTDARNVAGPAGEVHDRTPVMLPGDRVAAWLDPGRTDPADVSPLLTGLAPPELEARPVTPAVGNVGNDNPDLIETLPAAVAQPLDLIYA